MSTATGEYREQDPSYGILEHLISSSQGLAFVDALDRIMTYDSALHKTEAMHAQVIAGFLARLRAVANKAIHSVSGVDKYGTEVDADDLVSTAISKAWMTNSTIKSGDIIKYLNTVIYNELRDTHRKKIDATSGIDVETMADHLSGGNLDQEYAQTPSLEPEVVNRIVQNTIKSPSQQLLFYILLLKNSDPDSAHYANYHEQINKLFNQLLDTPSNNQEGFRISNKPFPNQVSWTRFKVGNRQGNLSIVKEFFSSVQNADQIYIDSTEGGLKLMLNRLLAKIKGTYFLHKFWLEQQGLSENSIEQMLGKPTEEDEVTWQKIITLPGGMQLKMTETKPKLRRDHFNHVMIWKQKIAEYNAKYGTNIQMGLPTSRTEYERMRGNDADLSVDLTGVQEAAASTVEQANLHFNPTDLVRAFVGRTKTKRRSNPTM